MVVAKKEDISRTELDLEAIEEKQRELERYVVENIDKGQQLFDIYKGQGLQRGSGKMTNQEALSLGHLGGVSIVIINSLIYVQKVLNKVSSIEAELVPVMKKTKKGMIWVDNEKEAKQLGELEGYKIREEHDKYFFEYPGKTIHSAVLIDFAYDIARSSGSWQGETKVRLMEALSNIKPVPIFPNQGMTSNWETPNEAEEDD